MPKVKRKTTNTNKARNKKALADKGADDLLRYKPDDVKEAARILVYSNWQKGQGKNDGSVASAATIIGVARCTMYEWLANEEHWFRAELENQRIQLHRLGLNAVQNLRKAGDKGSDTANIYLAKCAFKQTFDDALTRERARHVHQLKMEKLRHEHALAEMQARVGKLEEALSELPAILFREVGADGSVVDGEVVPKGAVH